MEKIIYRRARLDEYQKIGKVVADSFSEYPFLTLIIDDLKKRFEYAEKRVNGFDKKDENVELFTFLSDIVLEVYFKQHLIEYILNKIWVKRYE